MEDIQPSLDDILWKLMDKQLTFHEQRSNRCVCGSTDFIKEDILTCRRCKHILDPVFDSSPEWRWYYGNGEGSKDNPSRCGLPTNSLLPKSSLGSIVGRGSSDNKDLHCVRKLQTWTSMPYSERRLLNVFDKFSNSTNNMGISQRVLHDAKIMYKNVSGMKISRGDKNEGLIASCVYYACIIRKVPRSKKEIADMFNISTSVLTKGNARFQKCMPENVRAPSPQDFISRFGSKLNLSKDEISHCIKLVQFLEENSYITENAPTSTAAGTIAFYCNVKSIEITKRYIASVCGISEMTVSKSVKELSQHIESIRDFLNKL